MKKRQKMLIFFAAMLIIAAFLIINLTAYFNKKPADTSKGIMRLKEMEAQDITEVEEKIQAVHGTDTGNEEAIRTGNYKELFANSVIMGDSITESIVGYGFLNSSSVVAEMGISLTSLDGHLAAVTELKPKYVFLAYGSNDIGHVGEDFGLFREEYESFVKELKKALPKANIYVNSIFPVQEQQIISNGNYANVDQYNQVIKEMCQDNDLEYLDNSNIIKDEYYEPDGYHMVADFYPYWLNNMAKGAGL